MADRTLTPTDFDSLQFPSPPGEDECMEASRVISQLEQTVAQSKNKRKARGIRRNEYHVGDGSYLVSSWHFTEYMYKKVPCPFPILARGLFTRPSEDGAGYDIVARGYDKFFNLGEVAQTHPDWLKDHTSGPYELTVKENGCIILVGALNESQLLVTSKHSTGAIENADVSHSQVGDQWVDRHLATRQLTRADLASFLYQHQVTAVLELCDDEFEEHILEYTGDRRGLYLHGVNHNSATLHTWPSSLVTQVADHFGFHRTPYYTKSTYQEAAAFADQFHKEGTLEGRAVEGFVLRCLNKDTGKHFMYKIKYDMPYLLYREWREVTKRIIANKPIRIQHPLTHKYVRWVRGYLADHPDLAKQYVQNKRIIAVRDAFLAHMKQEGEDPEAMLQESASRKVVLVPIATVGCGKTTLARALVALYSCGHVQNDNINSKRKGAQAFNESVLNVMVHHDLVVADRNNHLARLRDSLTEAISDQYVNCRFVALYWSVDQVDMEKVFRQAVRRIRQRGENHQSLTPNRTQNFEYVIWDFLKNFQPLDTDSSADHLIEDTVVLDPLADTRKNLDTVIDFLVTQLNMRRPSTEEVDQAFAAAMEYKPDVRKNVKSRNQRSSAAYYGLKVDEDLAQVLPAFLRQRLGECQDVSGCRLLEECTKVMEQLQTNGRLPDTYHVTLVHGADTKNSPENTALYNDYEKRWALGDEVPVSISLDYIVWNDELATAHVSSLTADPTSHSYRPASGKPLHLTLGTYSDKVKPYQSNVLLRNIQEQYGSLEEYAHCFFEKQQDESPELQSPRLVQLSPPLTLTGYLHKYF